MVVNRTTNSHEQLCNTDKYYWLERACSNECNNICKKAHTDRTARWAKSTDVVGEIQCCSDQGACSRVHADNNCYSGDTSKGDENKYDYLDAVRICAQDNKRLCTKAELLSKDSAGCCGKGCNLDGAIVWTSDSQPGLFIRSCVHVYTIIYHRINPTTMVTFLSSYCRFSTNCIDLSVISRSYTRVPLLCNESITYDSLNFPAATTVAPTKKGSEQGMLGWIHVPYICIAKVSQHVIMRTNCSLEQLDL